MSATISVTENAVLVLLGQCLESFIPGAATVPPTTEIVIGQVNRVPEPASDDYVVMTPILRSRLEQTSNAYVDATDPSGNPSGVNAATAPTELTIQLDFHGPNSGDYAQMATTLLRDEYASDFFQNNTAALAAAPLYTSDPRQTPFENGEDQIEERWSVDAAIQINPVITVPQSFASTLGPVGLINIQATYPL